MSKNIIKPGVTYCNSSSSVENADVESAELMIEAKFNDPFKEVPTPKGFRYESDRARQTLGQVTSYATSRCSE